MTSTTLLKARFWVLATIPILLASTCEKPVKLDIKEPVTNLFVSSNFKDRSDIEVEISKITHNFLEPSVSEYITDATVVILEDELIIEELSLILPTVPREAPKYVTTELKPETGKEYIIQIDVEGFKTLRARSVIPARIDIKSFLVGDVSKVFNPLENKIIYNFPVYLAYDDPLEETNFYHLKLAQQVFEFSIIEGDTVSNGVFLNNIGFSPENDNNFVNAYFAGGILLQDDPFEGQYGFNLEFNIDPSHQKLGKLFLELRTVSEDYYRFHNSLDHQNQQGSNTGGFEQPVIPYYNVENGNGIFAGYTQALDSVFIEIP